MEAERWPVDFDKIVKGYVIPWEQVQAIVGVVRYHKLESGRIEDAEFQKKLIGFKARLDRELRRREIAITTCLEDGSILFLDDETAVDYNIRVVDDTANRKKVKAFRQLVQVDPEALKPFTRKRWEARLAKIGAELVAIRNRPAKVEPIACKRKTPGLNG